MSGDRDNFFQEVPVAKARKAHCCTLCRKEIPPGASYVRVSCSNCGEHISYAVHADCLACALEVPAGATFRAESTPAQTGDFLRHE